MSVAAILALALLAQARAEGIEQALAANDYAAAWELMEAQQDPLEQLLWRAEILYRAGDPSGALEAARAGLESAPQHLRLLFRAAGAALWLEDPAASAAMSERLERAALESPDLSSEERPAWIETAQDFRARSAALAAHVEARERAVAHARLLSLAGVGGLLGLFGWSARRQRGSTA